MALTATWELARMDFDVWVEDISADVLPGAHFTGRGIPNPNETDRLAHPASLVLELNNSVTNSQGEEGYYYPLTSDYFRVGNRIRLTLTDGTYTKRYRFYIDDIVPVAGKYGIRRTRVTARCYSVKIHQNKVKRLALATDKSGPELIALALGNLTFDPKATQYDAGLEDYTVAFYDLDDKHSFIAAAMLNVLRSDYGRVFILADSTYGETVRYFSRGHFGGILPGTEDLAFDGNMLGLDTGYYGSEYKNRFLPTTNPAKIGTSNVVLWTLQEEIVIPPGQTYTMSAYYRDPDGGGKISGSSILTPVSGTDYTFGSTSGASDINAQLGVTVVTGPNSATVILVNNYSAAGYVSLMQLRGRPVRYYDEISREELVGTDPTTYGTKDEQGYQANYWSSFRHLQVLGEHLDNDFGYRQIGKYLDWIPTKSATDLANFLQTDLGAYLKINETIKDYDPNALDYFYLVGEDLHFLEANHIKVRWYIEGASETYFAEDGDGNIYVDENGDPFYFEG